jgi:PAS domain S-box-containing protein
LAAGFPTLLLWGRDLIQVYNDAYVRLMSWRKVPLGAGFRETWPEFFAKSGASFEAVLRGETVVTERSYFSHAEFEGGRPAWLTASIEPVRDEAGEVAGIWIVMIDSTQQALAEATVRENEAQLAQLLELLPVGVTFFDTERNVVWRNPEMQRLLRLPQSHSAHVPTQLFDGDHHQLDPDKRPVIRALRGESVRPGEDLLFEIAGERKWIREGAVPFIRDGKIAGCIAVAHDITEAKKNAEHMKVLVAELQHRTRNLIAVVRALVDKTLEGSASLDDFRAKFVPRLAALARVQGLLSSTTDAGNVTFDELLRAELAAYAAFDETEARVTLEGPTGLRLRPSMVQMLALAIHELATNASKYGAFAQPAASLAVRWHVQPASEPGHQYLCVDWCESGVAMPQAGARSGNGYGRELIEHALPYQLGVKTTYALGADGVHCTLCLPVESEPVMAQRGGAARLHL